MTRPPSEPSFRARKGGKKKEPWFVAVEVYPPLKLLPGDLVRFDPTQEWPLEIIRAIDTGHAPVFWSAVSSGALQPVCGLNPPAEEYDDSDPGDTVDLNAKRRELRLEAEG